MCGEVEQSDDDNDDTDSSVVADSDAIDAPLHVGVGWQGRRGPSA
jgi:hypothetical protein